MKSGSPTLIRLRADGVELVAIPLLSQSALDGRIRGPKKRVETLDMDIFGSHRLFIVDQKRVDNTEYSSLIAPPHSSW